MRQLLRIALRNVARNRRRSLLTIAAIFLGVGVMLSMRGLLNGLQSSLKEGVIYARTGALQVHKAGYMKLVVGAPLSLDLPADEAFLAKIRAVPHVTAAAPRILFGGMVNANDTTVFAMVTALEPAAEYQVCPRRKDELTEGALLRPDDKAGAVLAGELARRIGLTLGGTGALLSGDQDGVLNGVDVRLAGLNGLPAAPGMESKIMAIPLALAQELLRMPGRATEIAVGIDDLSHLPGVKTALQAALGPAYEVHDWHDIAGAVEDALKAQDALLSIVAGIFFFVALIGIANTMLMNVLERTREIGTMMAVGVRRRQILQLFLFEAALLALVGASAGALAGQAVVQYLSAQGLHIKGPAGGPLYLYPSLTLSYSAAIVLAAAVGAALSALYPAWKAARMRPVEALTHA